ncbi:hypothetical protein DPMN_159335 [Dreissena polymorpha]|uniref:Uncharacterized protein n=1 Tax=Dreissena polymorpha TaxID=45954 RepID=A0A9D4IP37_DREPO|nr:hypothetical protein DPMN_159335 [Dreissena polymorpha]
MFTASLNWHTNSADPGAYNKSKIRTKAKQVGRSDVFRPADEIVETVMKEMVTEDDVCLPLMENPTRAVNLHRQKMRPKEPLT